MRQFQCPRVSFSSFSRLSVIKCATYYITVKNTKHAFSGETPVIVFNRWLVGNISSLPEDQKLCNESMTLSSDIPLMEINLNYSTPPGLIGKKGWGTATRRDRWIENSRRQGDACTKQETEVFLLLTERQLSVTHYASVLGIYPNTWILQKCQVKWGKWSYRPCWYKTYLCRTEPLTSTRTSLKL